MSCWLYNYSDIQISQNVFNYYGNVVTHLRCDVLFNHLLIMPLHNRAEALRDAFV